MTIKMYEVGESVLDKIRGIRPKIWDVAVVAPDLKTMISAVDKRTKGVQRHSNGDPVLGSSMSVSAFDMSGNLRRFYLCRKEGLYQGGSYSANTMTHGTIDDFLSQCPFTSLAIAKDLDTNVMLDPYGGIEDIQNDVLKCTDEPQIMCEKHPGIILQGIRLSITKKLYVLDPSFRSILNSDPEEQWIKKVISLPPDDIKAAFNACFEFDSSKTIHFVHTELFWLYHALLRKNSSFKLRIENE